MGTISVYDLEYGLDGMCCLVGRMPTGYAEGYTVKENEIAANLLNNIFYPSLKADQYIYMIACDKQMKVLGLFIVAYGDVNKTGYSIRSIIIRAMLCNACNIIIARNDPDRDWKFSKEELDNFHKLKETAWNVGITVKDYLILSENLYLSITDQDKQ